MIIKNLGLKENKTQYNKPTKVSSNTSDYAYVNQKTIKNKIMFGLNMIKAVIFMILISPFCIVAGVGELLLKHIWNNKYRYIAIATLIVYMIYTYGLHNVQRTIPIIIGGCLLLFGIANFWAILSMLFYGGIIYLIYWCVARELTR